MKENLLTLHQISKKYDSEKQILNKLDLSVKEGQIIFLVGPNGAGKTTLVKIILGLLSKDEGQIVLRDKEINLPYSDNIKSEFGYLADEPIFIEYLTSIENLQYYNAIYRKNWSYEEMLSLLKRYRLEESIKRPVKDFSRGMRQKLSLSCIDIINPKIIVMDEPTIGLDIIAIDYLKSHILHLKNLKKSLIITSHDMSFCEEIADQIYILNNGKAVKLDDSVTKSKEKGIIQKSILENIKS